jgi:hypothetical protein
MGIVSIVSTRGLPDRNTSPDDADDSPRPIDLDDETGESAPVVKPDRHLTVTPLTGVFVTVVLLLGGAAAAVAVGSELHSENRSPASTSSAQPAPGNPSHGASAAGASVAGTTTMLDLPSQGFSLRYPAAWKRVSDGGATGTPGSTTQNTPTMLQISGENAVSIRTFSLQKPVSNPQLADMRAVTDAILSTPGAKLTILDVRPVEVGGLPAVYYLYYFPSGQQQGIHAHYFVFNGARMYSMVFQVVPPSQFPTYAAAFDAVVASFRVSS